MLRKPFRASNIPETGSSVSRNGGISHGQRAVRPGGQEAFGPRLPPGFTPLIGALSLLGLAEPAGIEVDDRLRGPGQEPNREFLHGTLLEDVQRRLGADVIHIEFAPIRAPDSLPIRNEIEQTAQTRRRTGTS